MLTGRVAQKRGFSLVETIVSVGIVAAMAAVVVPQVVKQFDASDTTSLQQDLKNLQTAIETFTVNHRGVFPGDLDDLANPVASGAFPGAGLDTSLVIGGTIAGYTSATLWKGPYVDFSVAAGGTKTSGYGSVLVHNFVCYEATGTHANDDIDGIGTNADQGCPSIDPGDRLFLAIRITGLGDANDGRFQAINDLIDGSAEGVARATAGRIRLLDVGGTMTVFYLAAPLN